MAVRNMVSQRCHETHTPRNPVMDQRSIEVPPRASVLIESMRDIGYSLETAIADVIDNSITAGARNIDLFAAPSPKPLIAVVDDGCGMTLPQLLEAMTPGSKNPLDKRDRADLGRFGLGLKTASFSQCRRLTVATQQNGSLNAATWDLAHVARHDKWEILIPPPEAIPWIEKLPDRGTIVLWEDLDRVIEGESARAAAEHFSGRLASVSTHLELVFHRFINGERGHQKINIRLNNRPLKAFDPFLSGHPATITGPSETIHVGEHSVRVRPYTIPHHQKLRQSEVETLAGPEGYIKNQGFYVYRERRLIIYGTWFGLARQTELTKLSRVQVDIPNELDSQWKIDVKKASAQPPLAVRKRLRSLIDRITGTSKRVYTSKGRRLESDQHMPTWKRVVDKNEIKYEVNRDHPAVEDVLTSLPNELATRVSKMLEFIEASLPLDMLFADMGDQPGRVMGNSLSDPALRQAVSSTAAKLLANGIEPEVAEEMLQHMDPFKSNWKKSKTFLDEFMTGKSNDHEPRSPRSRH